MPHYRQVAVPGVFQEKRLHAIGEIGNAADDKIVNSEAAGDAELWINMTDHNGGTLQNISLQATSEADDADPSNDDQWSEVATLADIVGGNGAFRVPLARGTVPMGRRMRLRGEIINFDMTFEALLLYRE